MRKVTAQLAVLLAAGLVVVAGISGAYSYGRDYDLHRGFATLVPLRRAGAGRLLSVTFYSSALRRDADYLVYLPPHYSSRRRYPAYYLLHGMPGQPKVFVDIANMDVRLDNQLSLGRARPMILVYPDGRIGGSVFSDSEWANTPAGAFESYVIEVMHNVDHRFRTVPHRQDRVIAGFSAGAYGAINIALHHLADFANVQTWSGYFSQTHTGVFSDASAVSLAYNSPIDYIARRGRTAAAHPLRVYMFAGRDDSASREQQPMIRALRAAGAQVQYAIYRGGHDWSVWYPRLNQMLDLASWDAAHPQPKRRASPPGHPAGPGTAPQRPPAAAVPTVGHASVSALAPIARHPRPHHSELRLLSALLLALISAALINLGFVLQHRGHTDASAGGRAGLVSAFRERSWLLGQAVGWIGFTGQIVAVALAPLTLVQAFSAGSLALSVPFAARVFGYRVSARQCMIVAVITLSLVSLPIGFATGHGRLHSGLLIAAALTVTLATGLAAPVAGTTARAIAAGAFYGAADAAIKAVAVTLRFHGTTGPVAGWGFLAALCTLGGFLSFQAALRDGDAVRPLSLMNAFTAVSAVALGVAAFGEPLGNSPAAGAAHLAAIALVLACVRPLARAQQRLADRVPSAAADERAGSGVSVVMLRARRPWARSPRRPGSLPPARHRLRAATRAALVALALAVCFLAVLVACSVVVLGLIYRLRGMHALAIGPRVPDALPLLQLAGFDGQPVTRVLVAGLAAGLVLGAVLIRVSPPRRLVLVGVLGAVLMLAGSDASYALAHNLRLDQIMLNRSPGAGPWLEALFLAAASALPGRILRMGIAAVTPRLRDRRVLAPLLAAAFSLAVLGALVLPSTHARALARPTRHQEEARLPVRQLEPPVATPVARRPSSSRADSKAAIAGRSNMRASWKAAAGRLVKIFFYSKALGRWADYLVYAPAEYNPARPLPVFYMLHGMPGRPLAFTANADVEATLEALIRQHRVAPMILVFPDGRIGGKRQTDSEWADTPSGRFESYVVNVVNDVDGRFATRPCRQDRAIAGLSAGAYGAANIGLHQVGRFGVIQVWSGYFIQTRTGVFAHATRAQLAYDSPLDYVWTMRRALERYRLRVFLYVGARDHDREQIVPMAAALKAEGAEVGYAIYRGGHSWNLWSPLTAQMLIMASDDFAAASRCTSPALRSR